MLARLDGITVFDLRGSGTFATHIGPCVYGTEPKSTIARKSLCGKSAIRRDGLRSPITHRIDKGVASVTWGCANTKFADDVSRLLGYSAPAGRGEFLHRQPIETKSDVRSKEHVIVNMFGKCSTAR